MADKATMPKTWKEALARLNHTGQQMRSAQKAYFSATKQNNAAAKQKWMLASKSLESEYDQLNELIKYYLDNNTLKHEHDTN